MKRIATFCAILGVLLASLEGAADIGTSVEPCCQTGDALQNDPLAGHADPSATALDDRNPEACIVCTPLCHCGSHGGALVVDTPRGGAAGALLAPMQISVRWRSVVDPPFLPPPIL